MTPWGESVRVSTYTVQNGSDMAAGVDGGLFAAELDDFSEEADGLGYEGFEIGLGDPGGCFSHGGMGCFWWVSWRWWWGEVGVGMDIP
jgi:hypothetical protein